MSAAGAIEMGRAFVRLFADDTQLQATLKGIESQVVAWSARTSAASMSATKAAAIAAAQTAQSATAASAAASAAASGAIAVTSARATGGIGLLNAALTGLWVRIRTIGVAIATSITKLIVTFGALALIVKKSGIGGNFLDPLLNTLKGSKVQMLGVWAQRLGLLTGNSLLQGLGGSLRRANIAADLVQGTRQGGAAGLLGASLRSTWKLALWSVQSTLFAGAAAIAKGLGVVIFSPLKTVGGLVSGMASIPGKLFGPLVRGASGAFAAIGRLIPGFKSIGGAAAESGVAAARTGGLFSALGGIGSAVMGGLVGIATKVGLIVGAAVFAARSAGKQFATMSADVTAKAEELGISIREATNKVYGTKLAGALISPQDIAMGAKLNKAYTELAARIKVAWAQVGAAVAPVLMRMTQNTIAIVTGIARWASENRALIGTLFEVGMIIAKVAAVAGVLFAGLWLAGPVIAVLSNPITLVIAGLSSLYLLFGQGQSLLASWTGSLQAAAAAGDPISAALLSLGESLTGFGNQASQAGQFVAETFGEMRATAQTTMQGIGDALAAGDLGLAAQIGLSGISAAWVTVRNSVMEIWTNLTSWLATSLVDGGWMAPLNDMVTMIENALDRIRQSFNDWVSWFQETLGLIDAKQAEAQKMANSKATDERIDRRNEQAARDNKTFREQPGDVKANIVAQRDAQIAQLRQERAAAQANLQAQATTAATKRQAAEKSIEETASSAVAGKTSTTIQFGGAYAGQAAGNGPMQKLTKSSEDTAKNTKEMIAFLKKALSLA